MMGRLTDRLCDPGKLLGLVPGYNLVVRSYQMPMRPDDCSHVFRVLIVVSEDVNDVLLNREGHSRCLDRV